MFMIPSVFMALRIVTGNSVFALLTHAGFAAAVLVVLVVRLWQVDDADRRTAMVLLATVLMTPYLHSYDLALLLCGALLVARRWSSIEKGPFPVELLVMLAWALPHVVVVLNTAGVPISPLLILPLLLLA
jgi:alpha-1,2-mannosyltransferase